MLSRFRSTYPLDVPVDKQQIRRSMRAVARPSSSESAAVRQSLASWLLSRSGAAVLTYLPLRGEVDLRPLHDDRRWQWFVTRTPVRGWLTVHRLDGAGLERHRFGFDQPVAGSQEAPLSEIEVALVPGVAFSSSGVRLGHGLGYYDELLGRCNPMPEVVGVMVERFVRNDLPVDDHDAHVRWLATERGVRRVDSGVEATGDQPSVG